MIARIVIGASLGILASVGLLAMVPIPQAPTIAPEAPQAAQPAQVVYAPANEREQWAYDMATMLGNSEPTIETIALIVAWQQAENTTAAYNPLATSQEMPGATVFNSHGVKNYVSREQGLEATAITLGYSYDGYADIREGIGTNDVQRALAGLAVSPWAPYDPNYGTAVHRLYEITLQGLIGAQKPAQQAKCPVTDTMQVSAHFTDTSSGYWAGQAGGMHNGTDYAGNPGDSVYAPFAFVVEDVGYYGDPGRVGYYIQGRFADGVLFYAGHLGTVAVAVGQRVVACDTIGTIGDVYHTHIKIATADKPIPCESMGCDDFETYWSER